MRHTSIYSTFALYGSTIPTGIFMDCFVKTKPNIGARLVKAPVTRSPAASLSPILSA